MRGSLVLRVLAIGAPFVAAAAAIGQPPAESNEVFRFLDDSIVESSGLVLQDDLAVTVNDSGGSGRVFVVDPKTGQTVGTTTFAEDPEDIEALAPAGSGQVWVGDIGDNRARRGSVSVTRVPYGPEDIVTTGDRYALTYPDGARDAETLLAHPGSGRLFVVTKGIFGGQVYAAPRRLDSGQENRLRAVGSVLGVATDGAFFSDGRHVVVRSYTRAVVYAWPTLETVAEIDLPSQEQGEGIAVTSDNRLLLSSEGRNQPVLEVSVPDSALEPVDEPRAPAGSPAPELESERAGSATDSGGGHEADEPGRSVAPYVGGGLLLVVLLAFGAAVRHWRHGTRRRPG